MDEMIEIRKSEILVLKEYGKYLISINDKSRIGNI